MSQTIWENYFLQDANLYAVLLTIALTHFLVITTRSSAKFQIGAFSYGDIKKCITLGSLKEKYNPYPTRPYSFIKTIYCVPTAYRSSSVLTKKLDPCYLTYLYRLDINPITFYGSYIYSMMYCGYRQGKLILVQQSNWVSPDPTPNSPIHIYESFKIGQNLP